MNGTINTNIYNELTLKVNYFSDVYRIRKALNKYKPIYLNENIVNNNIENNIAIYKKSRPY